MTAGGLRWYEKLGLKMERREGQYNFKVDTLLKYETDMTKSAMMGRFDPVIGREKEIERLTQVLSKRRKKNACLIGDPGVGKTAIVEGLAMKIAAKSVPSNLLKKKVFSVDMARLVAGGQFEARLIRLLDEVRDSCGSVILFIDDLHSLFGRPEHAAILKPALARADITCIGATTAAEYRKHVEKDAALKRRFLPIEVMEPSRYESIQILKGLIHKYQFHHRVCYDEAALVSAVDLSTHYMMDLFLPDKAIDLIDEAGALASLLGHKFAKVVHVERAVAAATGIPLASVESQLRIEQLEFALKLRLIGQDDAVAAVSRAIRRARAGVRDETKPIGCFLFTGPTGVGKTEMAKILAIQYFGSAQAMLRLDMNEFMDPHHVSRQLTEFVRRRPHTLVLLDKFDKADGKVLSLLLQIFDGKGKTVDFRHTIIILTGGEESLTAELFNRFDQVVVFKPLELEHIRQILLILLRKFYDRIAVKKKIKLAIVGSGLNGRLILEGYSKCKTYGAGMLKSSITRLVEDELADQILNGSVREGDTIMMDYSPEENKVTTWIERPGYFRGSDSPRWMICGSAPR